MADEVDTKPTIEIVLERLGAFRDAVESRLSKIETDLSELRKDVAAGFHKLDRRLEVLSGDIVKLGGDIGFIEDRLEKLEAKPS